MNVSAIAEHLALDARQLIFVIATPFFVATAAYEYLRLRHDPTRTNWAEANRNFMLGAGYQVTELLFAGVIAFPVSDFAYAHRLFALDRNVWTALAAFVGTDLCFYFMHRAAHRVRWFWAAHVVHHSSERMNFSTAMRQNATNIFNGNWLFFVPLAWLGLPPDWLGIALALSLVYQFFVHTTLIGKLHPAIEYVFNTPNHHRTHHGKNAGYLDRNYAGVLIVWDRLFGTFVEKDESEVIEYGITRPVKSDNLLVLWTHEYVDMFRDMLKPGPLVDRLMHLWMPPEWQRSLTSSPAAGHGATRPAAGHGATSEGASGAGRAT